MAARLVAEEGFLKGLILPLEEGDQWVLGRDPDSCQLLLEDPAASRKHLLLRKSPDGIVLENLSKTNPVEVNNEALVEPRVLHDGDLVKIGSGTFRFDVPNNNEHPKEDEILDEDFLEEEARDSIFEDNDEIEKTSHKASADINFDFLEVGRWLLKVIGGPNNGAEFSMQENTSYIIGTDPHSCDIVFHDTSVSRQHARVSISGDEEIVIEDLKSRNGTLVDGQKVEGRETLSTNTIVTLGTTSFVIYDREGNMQTIISPLLPSIVKVLQNEDAKDKEEVEQKAIPVPMPTEHTKELLLPPKEKNLGNFILTALVTSLLAIAGIGVLTLFKSEPIVIEQQVQPDAILADTFKDMPNIKYSFNKASGRLFLIGHVLTSQDKNQLMYNMQGLNFIKSIDDTGIIIDEYVWQEANLLLNKNIQWRGITIQSPSAGQFVLSGYLQTRKEAEQLYEYIASNFPYMDRLEKRVIVDEDVLASARNDFEQVGIRNVSVQFSNGEILLTGGIAEAKQQDFNHIVTELKKIPGVRNVRVQVNQLAPDQALINISDKYEVTGFSVQGSVLSVIINGRIVAKGDVLDGMLIKEIIPGTIFLEKNGIKYRIDFNN